MYKDHSANVAVLTEAKFPSASSTFVWLVHFYSTSDRASSRDELRDAVLKAAETLRAQGVRTGAVNCDRDGAVCAGRNAKPLPSMQACFGGECDVYVPDESSGAVHRPFSAEALAHFVEEAVSRRASTPRADADGSSSSSGRSKRSSGSTGGKRDEKSQSKSKGQANAHTKGEAKGKPAAWSIQNVRLSPQLHSFVSESCVRDSASSFGLLHFTAAFESPLLLGALAFAYRGRVAVADIRANNRQLLAELQAAASTPLPALPLLAAVCGVAPGSHPSEPPPLLFELYRGDLGRFEEVQAFVDDFERRNRGGALCRAKLDELKSARAAERAALSRLTAADLRAMRVARLREVCRSLGVDTAGLVERSELESAVLAHLAGDGGKDGGRGKRGAGKGDGDDRRRRTEL